MWDYNSYRWNSEFRNNKKDKSRRENGWIIILNFKEQ